MVSKKYFLVCLLPLVISCSQGGMTPAEEVLVRSKGDTLVAQTFDTLRNTLLRQVGEKGFAGAVEFCNTNALSLTNSYADENLLVKRTSDKVRNAANAPDSMEQRILSAYQALKQGGREMKPVVERDAMGRDHYFKPIMMQAMCLNCHGDREVQIHPDTWSAIQAKYPSDAAWGYKEGDLRGIWHAVFISAKK